MKNFIFGVIFFFENTVSGIQLYKRNINRSLIIFKKPRKMKNGFFLIIIYLSARLSRHH